MSCNTKTKIQILVKPRFFIFQWKFEIRNLPFYIYRMPQSVLKFYLFSGLINMVARVNLLFIHMKMQGSFCNHIFSLLENAFAK